MPYKNQERKHQWEQAHRQERTERRKSQRRDLRLHPQPVSAEISPRQAHTVSASPVAAALRTGAKRLLEDDTQAHPCSKKADVASPSGTLRSATNKGSWWGVLLAVGAVGAALFLGFFGGFGDLRNFPGRAA